MKKLQLYATMWIESEKYNVEVKNKKQEEYLPYESTFIKFKYMQNLCSGIHACDKSI